MPSRYRPPTHRGLCGIWGMLHKPGSQEDIHRIVTICFKLRFPYLPSIWCSCTFRSPVRFVSVDFCHIVLYPSVNHLYYPCRLLLYTLGFCGAIILACKVTWYIPANSTYPRADRKCTHQEGISQYHTSWMHSYEWKVYNRIGQV